MSFCVSPGVLVLSWYPPGLADDNGEPAEDLVPAVLDAAYRHNLKVKIISTFWGCMCRTWNKVGKGFNMKIYWEAWNWARFLLHTSNRTKMSLDCSVICPDSLVSSFWGRRFYFSPTMLVFSFAAGVQNPFHPIFYWIKLSVPSNQPLLKQKTSS